MPEGDTLHRLADVLGPALQGRRLHGLELPRSTQPTAHLLGRPITRVQAVGKNLLVGFEGGWALHVHLKMSGVWHLYREGEPWRRSRAGAVAILTVEGAQAVCFRAPVVRLLSPLQVRGDPALKALGPDVLGEALDVSHVVARLRASAAPTLGEALLDQRALAGIGNVYRSEVLFNRQLSPFSPVTSHSDATLEGLVAHAREVMQRNVSARRGSDGPSAAYRYTRTTRDGPGGPLSVYGRQGQPCFDCGTPVRRATLGGTLPRSVYWCPTCQAGPAPPG